MLKRLFSSRVERVIVPASLPAGQRVYAVGDIHGRRDLLDDLLTRIDRDDAARPGAQTTLVFLGDLVDRGPTSAQVVERLLQLSGERPDTRFLLGNHEEIFLLALSGDLEALRLFCRVGGRETILSYGMDEATYAALDYRELAACLPTLVPAAHREFLEAFEDLIVLGDYAFVHAGVKPGVALEAQRAEELRWIREPFLSHRQPFDKFIVHGHTITEDIDDAGVRIGIDTGAYRSNRLTALGLESDQRWVIDTISGTRPLHNSLSVRPA